MLEEVYVQKRRWGLFGWLFMLLFIGWNATMLSWLVRHILVGHRIGELLSDWEQTAAAIGTDAGVILILMVWAFGSVITGFFALLTRSRKSIITRKH